MQQKTSYPDWYRTLRAFLVGAAFGVIIFSGFQQLGAIPAPLPAFPSSFILVFTQLPVAIVLAVFEIVFGIVRYRRLRHQMDGRTAAA